MLKEENASQKLQIFPEDIPVIYKGVETSSEYLTMPDGTKIAIDILLPKGLTPGTRLPVVLTISRYWRSFALRIPAQPGKAPIAPRAMFADYLVPRGYAMLVVDVRGSGASSGRNPYPWSPAEVADYAEVVKWAVKQPWSNGAVGAVGISYEGTTAQLLAATGCPEVKAVVPQAVEFDVYTDVALPGGVFNEAFIQQWSDSNNLLDRNKMSALFPFQAKIFCKGVRPVDSDKDRSGLKKALQDHQQNGDVYQAIQKITYRDDTYGAENITLDDFSVFKHRSPIEASGATIFSWGSWLDAATAHTVLRRFCTFSNPQYAVIGGWSHDQETHGSPYGAPKAKPQPLLQEQWREITMFFNKTLLEPATKPNPFLGDKRLFYYTLGAEKWQETSEWPLPNTEKQRWYLAADHQLTTTSPESSSAEAADSYKINFQASTGKNNRWHTEMAKPVIYGNRARQDQLLLTYTSAPFAADTEITGYPVVTFYLSSTAPDGALFVYLEEVDEQNYVRYLTEGQLRLLHRKISEAAPPYATFGPYHTFKRADSQPVPPNQIIEVSFELLPTSVLIRQGRRIRLAIAGQDSETFRRIPAQGEPVLKLLRNQFYTSSVELPIIKK